MPVDLSLYLVTDSTPAILKGRDLCTVVEEAIKGGKTRELQSLFENYQIVLIFTTRCHHCPIPGQDQRYW
jgi:thiamine-phosphate diphosphorylase/hydroxyethylthiazole kinase